MKNNMFWIIPIALVILAELGADIISKEYSIKGHWYFWMGAMVAYIITNSFWLWGLRSGSGLARGALIFSVCSAIGAVVIGVYFYGEATNRIQIIGMILGALSLILIFWQ